MRILLVEDEKRMAQARIGGARCRYPGAKAATVLLGGAT